MVAILLALVNAVDYLVSNIGDAIGSPLVLNIVESFFASVAAGLILIGMAFLRPVPKAGEPLSSPGEAWPQGVKAALILLGLSFIVVAGIGFVGLARFASGQLVASGAILVTMYIGFLSGKAISAQHAFADTAVGKMMGARFALKETTLDQIGLVAGLGVYLVVLVIGIPLILMQWGFHFVEIWLWISDFFSEFTVGSIRVSLTDIMIGVLLFAFGVLATRRLKGWLQTSVLPRSQLDIGVRNSVTTGLGYIGIAIAALIGISAAGIDLSSLALVAGALSLGIGFGLQNIVSNFVSGLILLVERPFKVGDWVVTSSAEGIVKRVSVRATEIETFQQQSIIVPNSELINAAVGNWTHRNLRGRLEIPIGAGYNSDPRKVMDLLLEVANAHPKVLKTPEPFAYFTGFGDSSLDFEIRVYLADITQGLGVRNDIRLAIFAKFAEEGIEIPFPQRDVNLFVKPGSAPVAEPLDGSHYDGNPDRAPDNMGGLGPEGEEG
jgi:small-conductance mechanosensitive channel